MEKTFWKVNCFGCEKRAFVGATTSMMLEQLDYWHWWILGGLFLLLEAFVSGFFFVWLAVSAAVVGIAMLLYPEMGWKVQLVIRTRMRR